MEPVKSNLIMLLDESTNLLGALGLIRETCVVAAATVAKAALPIDDAGALSDLAAARAKIIGLGRALGQIIPLRYKVEIFAILSEALLKATQESAMESKDYRVNAWVFGTAAMVYGVAANVALEAHCT
jgi:hypothetical protein